MCGRKSGILPANRPESAEGIMGEMAQNGLLRGSVLIALAYPSNYFCGFY
ncbi:MAG: hypothetical protein JWQ27_2028 [Ferruginibacter sp.]|nr:hypothetical protein [Ferruginibacter sp.]